jgi:hypothetical protein
MSGVLNLLSVDGVAKFILENLLATLLNRDTSLSCSLISSTSSRYEPSRLICYLISYS